MNKFPALLPFPFPTPRCRWVCPFPRGRRGPCAPCPAARQRVSEVTFFAAITPLSGLSSLRAAFVASSRRRSRDERAEMIIFNSNENRRGDWGPLSFPLSHLLKLGGSFETIRGHLARTVLGSAAALEWGEKPGACFTCIWVIRVFQPGPGRQESSFPPIFLMKSPFAPFCKCMLPRHLLDWLACL